MKAPDFSGKADAELMQFCSVTSRTLTDLSRRIAASSAATSSMESEFAVHTDLLNAALSELDRRYSDPTGDEDQE